nr:hypothetical protein [uncultured Azospirillum sp.]
MSRTLTAGGGNAPDDLVVSPPYGVAGYEAWLRRGLDIYWHPSSTIGERDVAFAPLIVNSNSFEGLAPQLVRYAGGFPAGCEHLREAAGLALGAWDGQTVHAPLVLGELLRLLRRLPHHSHVSYLRRLLCSPTLMARCQGTSLPMEAFETAAGLLQFPDGKKLYIDLRTQANFWSVRYLPRWLEEMIRANHLTWLEGLVQVREELERAYPDGAPLRPLIGRLAANAGPLDRVLGDLARAGDLGEWLKIQLFGGNGAPFRLVELSDPVTGRGKVLSLVRGAERLTFDESAVGIAAYEFLYRLCGWVQSFALDPQPHAPRQAPPGDALKIRDKFNDTLTNWQRRMPSTDPLRSSGVVPAPGRVVSIEGQSL